MPYVNCPRCGLRTYTAGGLMWPETCPQCGTRLRTSAGRHHLRRNAPAISMLVDPDPRAPSEARRALDELAPMIGEGPLDNLQLLVTELVTNSVKHAHLDGGQPIGLNVFLDGTAVYVEVHDNGVGFKPSTPDLDPTRASGWGLWLLDELTTRWGIESAGGTTAWFEMPARAS